MKPLQIITVCLIGILVSSCMAPLTKAFSESFYGKRDTSEIRTYEAPPQEVMAAAVAAMEEIGKDNELTMWSEDEDSFFATTKRFVLYSSDNNYFEFKASTKDNKTEAFLRLTYDMGAPFATARFEMTDKSQYENFWSILESNLGEEGLPQEKTSAEPSSGQE